MDPNQLHPDTLKPATPVPPSPVQGPEYEVNSHNEIESTKKISRKVLILLGILLVLIPAGIFTYSKISAKPTVIQEVANIPTPTPAPNPTAGWQTYSNNGNNYSVRYPSEWQAQSADDLAETLDCVFLGITKPDKSNEAITVCYAEDDFSTIYPEIVSNPNSLKTTINGYDAYRNSTVPNDIYLLGPSGGFANISQGTLPDEKNFDLILSTFKFTAPTASPSPTPVSPGEQVFCTQEAKLCPDGSYVGRQGPNCEFSPCP